MKMESVDKLEIPDRYKEPFGTLLQMEVLYMELRGAVPRELEPLFDRAYNIIATRGETAKLKELIVSLSEGLFSSVEGHKV